VCVLVYTRARVCVSVSISLSLPLSFSLSLSLSLSLPLSCFLSLAAVCVYMCVYICSSLSLSLSLSLSVWSCAVVRQPHEWMGHFAHMNESCHTHQTNTKHGHLSLWEQDACRLSWQCWVMSHYIMSHMFNESCHAKSCYTHWISHVTHVAKK